MPAQGSERRQVHDLPPLRLEVIEYQALQVCCPQCQHVSKGPFPPQAAVRAQVKALAVYLLTYQLLPYARTAVLLHQVVGCAVSPGTLETWVQQAASQLVGAEEEICDALVAAPVLGNDETSIRVNGQHHWLHVARTDRWTHYARQRYRGKLGMDAIGILPNFQGTTVHDGLNAYPQYAQCQHALCNAHLLRELTCVAEHEQQTWAQDLIDHLRQCHAQVEAARANGAQQLPTPQQEALIARYHTLVQQGLAAQPPPPPPTKGRPKQTPPKICSTACSGGQAKCSAFSRTLPCPLRIMALNAICGWPKFSRRSRAPSAVPQGRMRFYASVAISRPWPNRVRRSSPSCFTSLATNHFHQSPNSRLYSYGDW